jgi:CubicO group peptidase (beta-lactamase class C family)
MRINSSYTMDPDVSALTDRLKEQIQKELDKRKINGFSVALTEKTGTLWSKGFGHADHKKNPVTPQTLFMIGSLSKAYTVAAFLRAVQAGLVALDDRLIDHYPEFNWKTRHGDSQREKITFRHLLTHWSGLQHNANLRLPEGGYCSFNEYMQRVKDMWQKYPVGTRFSYSNIGYDLVAAALQRITGQRFEAWMSEQVYKPLGMTRSTTVASEALNGEDVAMGHFGNSEFRYKDMVIPQIGSGAQYSSVDDMSRYVAMHLNRGTG